MYKTALGFLSIDFRTLSCSQATHTLEYDGSGCINSPFFSIKTEGHVWYCLPEVGCGIGLVVGHLNICTHASKTHMHYLNRINAFKNTFK